MGHYDFEAELWRWKGDAAWHFDTLPEDVSDEIEADAPARRGFGSARVHVRIGRSRWSTSVFPDGKRGAYILPVKQEVRRSEGIGEGDRVTVRVEVADAE